MPEKEKLLVGAFDAHLRNLLLPMGLVIDDVKLSGQSLMLERYPYTMDLPEPGKMEIFVSDASLAAFLERVGPAGLKRFLVEARQGKLHMQAYKTVLIDLKATAVCTLRVVDKAKLFVEIESVEVAGAGIKNLLETQLAKINPVIDVAMLPMRATIETVTLGSGGVHVHGHVFP